MKNFRRFKRLREFLAVSPVDTLARLDGPHDTIGLWRKHADGAPVLASTLSLCNASGGEFERADFAGDGVIYWGKPGEDGGLTLTGGRVDLLFCGLFSGLALSVVADADVVELIQGGLDGDGFSVGTVSDGGARGLAGGARVAGGAWRRSYAVMHNGGTSFQYGGAYANPDRTTGVESGAPVTCVCSIIAGDPASNHGAYLAGAYVPGDTSTTQQASADSSSVRCGDTDHAITIDAQGVVLRVKSIKVCA